MYDSRRGHFLVKRNYLQLPTKYIYYYITILMCVCLTHLKNCYVILPMLYRAEEEILNSKPVLMRRLCFEVRLRLLSFHLNTFSKYHNVTYSQQYTKLTVQKLVAAPILSASRLSCFFRLIYMSITRTRFCADMLFTYCFV